MRWYEVGLVVAGVLASGLVLSYSERAGAHGDVTPQAVDTTGLPDIGEEWLEQNPWRDPAGEFWSKAVEIGASGYNQNCARCHGLEVISGGLAPDLRFLEADIDGDEWYLERFRLGYTQNGITKMPGFGELLGQQAAWAIRTYIETRPDEGAMDKHVGRLKEIRESLEKLKGTANTSDKLTPLIEEMRQIAMTIETGSNAPVADSAASRAVKLLEGPQSDIAKAVEALTVGLSAAQ